MGAGSCPQIPAQNLAPWDLPPPPRLSTALITKFLLSGKEGQLTSSPGGRSHLQLWAHQPLSTSFFGNCPQVGGSPQAHLEALGLEGESGAGADFTQGP